MTYAPTRQEAVDSIIKIIQDNVAPEQWKDNGGTTGSIREMSEILIVAIAAREQEQIRRLLEEFRSVLSEQEQRSSPERKLQDRGARQ